MNKTRRLLTLLLALCMVAGMVPFAAFSATPEELANRKNSGSSTLVDTTINAVSDYVATAAVEKGTKPADGTTTGNPFPKGTAGSTSFRIPALVTLSNGSLVAAVDARWNTNYDGGGLDTLVSRSSDNGANWKYTFANYLGDNGNVHSFSSSCFIDPALAVAKDDTVYMLVDLYPYGIALNGANQQPSTAVGFNSNGKLLLSGNNHASYDYYLDGTVIKDSNGNTVSGYTVDAHFNITGNGVSTNLFFEDSPYKVVRTGYLYLTTSTDGGATWSAPKLLNVKTSSEMVCLVGPGRGLVTKSGMIVFPVYSFNGGRDSQRTSFIYSADGGNTWSRSANFNGAGWSSEAAVVELDSNTLRFFYRNGTSQLCYADYTLSNGKVPGGSWGSAVSTGIATNSDTQISAITYSKTIGGKQVILVSCPAGPNDAGAASSNASNRVNGKIFVFTVESNKTLTRKGTIAVPSQHNTTSNNFLYSCLTELSNGKVGILFEDNVSDSTNPQFCELSYVTYDIAQKLNLRFDVPATGPVYQLADLPQGVTVDFGTTNVEGWIMSVMPTTADMAGVAEYTAYDISITKADGTAFTGAAEVTLPLAKLTTTEGVYPFIITNGAVEKIDSFTVQNGAITFTAPHFSVMGVAIDEEEITGEDKVSKVEGGGGTGGTAGYYLDTDGFDDGGQYLIVFDGKALSYSNNAISKVVVQENGDKLTIDSNTDISSAIWNRVGTGLQNNESGKYLGISSSVGAYMASYQINAEPVDGGYKLNYYASWYYNLKYDSVNEKWTGVYGSADASIVKLYKYEEKQETGGESWNVDPTRQEALINAYTVDENLYAKDNNMATYRNLLARAQADLQTLKTTQYDTEEAANAALDALKATVNALKVAKDNLTRMITITVTYQLENGQPVQSETFSVAENATSLRLNSVITGTDGQPYKVDNTLLSLTGALNYTVTVEAGSVVDVVLVVGDTMTHTIEDIAYTDADITQAPNAQIATMTIEQTITTESTTVEDAPTTTVEPGSYIIVLDDTFIAMTSKEVNRTWAGTHLLAENHGKTVTDDTLWILEETTGGYYIRSADGEYLSLGSAANQATLGATGEVFEFIWNATASAYAIEANGWYLNNLGDSNTDIGAWSVAGTKFQLYKVVSTPEGGYTDVTFTGESSGKTTAKVGMYAYNVTVLKVPQAVTAENTPFRVGQNQTGIESENPVVTKLTTSVGTSYNIDLGITGTDIRWSTLDPNVATVDQNGVVTGTGIGETTLVCYVDGKAYTMPVVVLNAPTSQTKLCSIYVEDIIDTDVYYSWNLSGNLIEAQEGEVIRVYYSDGETFGISLYGAPHDGYALTFMSATNSAGTYEALQDKKDPTQCDYYNGAGGGMASLITNGTSKLYNEIEAANELGCDGAQCFSRNSSSTAIVDTRLTFISEKIVEITKEIEGVLATTKMQADYRHYYENMVAGAGEMLYYKITVTLERPETWIVENGVETNKSSLVYSNAILEETMPGAYFYTKEQDLLDGKWSGDLPENLRTNTIDITADLNKAWADDEEIRELTYYVVYKITDEDIPKFELKNHLNFKYDYNAVFSSAKEITATTAAHALISVVSEPLKDIVIDTPQPITLTGLDNKHLKFAFSDDEKDVEGYKAPTAKYGTVSISKEIVYEENENGVMEPAKDKEGYLLYNYVLTYTPDPSKGILTEPDAILVYGLVPDVNDGNKLKTKIVNGFNIFPATTVYYEENYIKWDGWNAAGSSNLPTTDTEDDAWYVDFVGDTEKRHNYGYDPIYEGSNAASGGTYVATSAQGASGTFDFTGTGFEIYANCTEETGYVMVLVKSNTTGQIRLYTVNTKVGAGSSAATNQQSGTYYSVPIVSVHDLAHDSYNVRIVKSTDYDEFGVPMTTSKPVQIDGVRIVQTMDPATSEDYFRVDSETGPSFVELRDLVLTGVDVEANVTNGEYPTTDQIISQVYSDTGSLNAVVWINSNPEYTDMKDLLENGPKNELYLWPGQAVTFKLNTGVTAQIGMKTVSGSSVTYTYNGASHTINSSTDMFYHNPSAEEVTITNNSGGVLSITLLKYWGASTETLLAEVSESQIAYALLSLRELPAKDAVLHVTAVDYTGEQIGSVRLAKPGAEGEYVVFTRGELLAQLPEGYMPLDEVADIRVTCGEERTVSARIGKVATLKVEYVRLYKHGEVDMGGTRVPVMGKKTVTETLTKVQASDGNAVFTAQEIWAAAPAGAVLHGLSDIRVAYGQTENISVFDTQLANSQVVPSIKL